MPAYIYGMNYYDDDAEARSEPDNKLAASSCCPFQRHHQRTRYALNGSPVIKAYNYHLPCTRFISNIRKERRGVHSNLPMFRTAVCAIVPSRRPNDDCNMNEYF